MSKLTTQGVSNEGGCGRIGRGLVKNVTVRVITTYFLEEMGKSYLEKVKFRLDQTSWSTKGLLNVSLRSADSVAWLCNK